VLALAVALLGVGLGSLALGAEAFRQRDTGASAGDLPVCFGELQSFSVLPSAPSFANLTRIQQPLLSPADAPAFVALPSDESELRQALSCASSAGLRVAVKGGGHSFAGYSRVAAPGFVVSLERMTDVTLDEQPAGGGVRVTVRGAARWEHVYSAFARSGNRYQVVGGLCPTVGVIGYTSGGGVGPLARAYGLAADNVLAFRLTLANGSATLTASPQQHADLYWALRGAGGGQFGVVSELIFQAHPGVPQYTWGTLCYANRTRDALSRVAKYADGLPRWLNLDAELDGADSLCLWLFAAQPRNETLAALAPFLDGAAPGTNGTTGGTTVQLQGSDCYWEAIQAFAEAKGYSDASASPFLLRSHLLPTVSAAAVDAIARAAEGILPAASCGQSLIQFGGRIGELSPGATAFPWRRSSYMLYLSCGFDGSAAARQQAQRIVDQWSAMVQPAAEGSYVNFLDASASLPDWAAQYYGANLPRLLTVKQQYNPPGTGPLRFPQEIGAQAGGAEPGTAAVHSRHRERHGSSGAGAPGKLATA